MTRHLRESSRFIYYEEQLTKHTAIMDRKSGAISNWNTGEEAEEEKRKLIAVDVEEFDIYCAEVDKD